MGLGELEALTDRLDEAGTAATRASTSELLLVVFAVAATANAASWFAPAFELSQDWFAPIAAVVAAIVFSLAAFLLDAKRRLEMSEIASIRRRLNRLRSAQSGGDLMDARDFRQLPSSPDRDR